MAADAAGRGIGAKGKADVAPGGAPSRDARAKPDHVFLIDGSGFIFRAFHALPPMTRADGTPVNAVFGFVNMLLKLIEDADAEYVAVIFDRARRTFRNDIYADYKAHRPDPPDELHQILVGRNDRHLVPGFAREARIGGDQVVGLEALDPQFGHVHGPHRFVGDGELGDQFVRRVGAVRLVIGVEVVAEGAPRPVEYDRHVFRVRVLDQLEQHVDEAIDGVDRRSVRAGHGRQGVEGAEDESRAVDQKDVVRFARGFGLGLRLGRRHGSMSRVGGRAFGENEMPAAIGANDRARRADPQENPGMAEGASAAVAGDRGVVDHDRAHIGARIGVRVDVLRGGLGHGSVTGACRGGLSLG